MSENFCKLCDLTCCLATWQQMAATAIVNLGMIIDEIADIMKLFCERYSNCLVVYFKLFIFFY